MNCPICKEYLLGHPDKCYKCGTDLSIELSEEQIANEQKRLLTEVLGIALNSQPRLVVLMITPRWNDILTHSKMS